MLPDSTRISSSLRQAKHAEEPGDITLSLGRDAFLDKHRAQLDAIQIGARS